MRLLLAIVSFLALVLAPLATPAVAAAASNPCTAEMMSQHGEHGQMPANYDQGDHAQLCCAGLASALPAATVMMKKPPVTKPLIAALPVTKLIGIQPAAADPPPRA